MRSLLSYVIPFIIAAPCSAQMNAGDVPAGYSILDPEIDLQLDTEFTMDSASFDLNCDGIPDIRAVLWQGEPAVDAPNSCALNLLDTELAICADFPQFNYRPRYYASGVPLECVGDFSWRSDSLMVLGDIGGFTAIGPNEIDSMYVAYNYDGQVGWLLISFDLSSGGGLGAEVEMQVHQVLQPCIIQSIDGLMDEAFSIYPNPVNGDEIRLEGQKALRGIEIFDLTGKILDQFSGNLRTIPAPKKAGMYLLRATHVDGRSSVVRFVRY